MMSSPFALSYLQDTRVITNLKAYDTTVYSCKRLIHEYINQYYVYGTHYDNVLYDWLLSVIFSNYGRPDRNGPCYQPIYSIASIL